MPKCCSNPDFVNGYIVWKVFKVKVCKNCGEAFDEMGVVSGLLFKYIFSRVWNGVIVIPDKELKR